MSQPVLVTRPARSTPVRRGGVRGAVAVGALAVLGVFAAPGGPLPVPEAAATTAVPTVRVDPGACTSGEAPPAGVTVVCTVTDAAARLGNGGTVVLAAGVHRGPLDLRTRADVEVSGEPGAVLDAGDGRFALSLRDVTRATVSGLVLRGGSAQTVWAERTTDVAFRGVTVEGGPGVGLQLRDATRTTVADSRVTGAGSAGVMELTGVTGSTYERLTVTANGLGPATYNGDGLQIAGSGVVVRDVVASGNGSSDMYEHGVYVASVARDVTLTRVESSGNSGVAVKLGGSGRLSDSSLSDDRLALYCGTTADLGWTVSGTGFDAPRALLGEGTCTVVP